MYAFQQNQANDEDKLNKLGNGLQSQIGELVNTVRLGNERLVWLQNRINEQALHYADNTITPADQKTLPPLKESTETP